MTRVKWSSIRQLYGPFRLNAGSLTDIGHTIEASFPAGRHRTSIEPKKKGLPT